MDFYAAEIGILSLAAVRVHDGVLAPDDIVFNYRAGPSGRGLIPPDLNLDGFVDASDVGLFTLCATGPTIPLSVNCRFVDFDNDGDGDQDDFGILQRCFTGPDTAASAGCMQ
jgi:hypothetical protein